MSVRLTTFALLSGASMLSAATVSERLDRLESEVAQLRSLLQKMAGEELARPAASRPRTATKGGRTHRIRSGDSYWSIARRFKTTVNALQAANPGVDPRRLTIGKLISIPGGDQSLPTPASSGTYRVKSGDILGRISEAHGIRLHQLLSANPGLNPRKLKIGTILTIPGQPSQPAPVANAEPELAKINPGKPGTSEDPKPASQPAGRPNPYLSDTNGSKQAEVGKSEEAELDKPRLVVIEEDLRFAEIAERYQTTVADLNRLNKRELSPKQMIKGGSQLYVPSP
ncbi:MAG: LysM peptidoglycan-binding domain-containing protein [Akkermansiaceae bacterium]|nr:LysM peptidoglycan-binding domain-containing protein [Akkermansiaceae bacterium]